LIKGSGAALGFQWVQGGDLMGVQGDPPSPIPDGKMDFRIINAKVLHFLPRIPRHHIQKNERHLFAIEILKY
jgi:hypothetical protein